KRPDRKRKKFHTVKSPLIIITVKDLKNYKGLTKYTISKYKANKLMEKCKHAANNTELNDIIGQELKHIQDSLSWSGKGNYTKFLHQLQDKVTPNLAMTGKENEGPFDEKYFDEMPINTLLKELDRHFQRHESTTNILEMN